MFEVYVASSCENRPAITSALLLVARENDGVALPAVLSRVAARPKDHTPPLHSLRIPSAVTVLLDPVKLTVTTLSAGAALTLVEYQMAKPSSVSLRTEAWA